jgi:hypothetical protein
VGKGDLKRELLARELKTMDIFLLGKAKRVAASLEEYVAAQVNSGVAPEIIREALLKDLDEGGRIFGEFRNAIKATVQGSTMRARDVAQFAEEGIDNIQYRWSAVLVNTCPDCLDRHGEVKTWDEWEAEGLPRTGATVCKENCKCVLIPADLSALEPIKREK